MLLLSATMLVGFILWSLSQENIDDDNDGPGGGLMQPVYAPPSA